MRLQNHEFILSAVKTAVLQPIPQDVFIDNKSAKVDVYDYAAQLNLLPVFKTLDIAYNPKSKKTGFYVEVTVPGTGIVGESYHPNVRAYAETGACVAFKKRAEELHQGEKMIVKDINTLTSSTGKKFLEYCKMEHKDWETYNFVTTSSSAQEVLGQLFLGTRLLSEVTMFKYIHPLLPKLNV
jgi:hypothetical protein